MVVLGVVASCVTGRIDALSAGDDGTRSGTRSSSQCPHALLRLQRPQQAPSTTAGGGYRYSGAAKLARS
jgi:hypothetical protein